MSDAVVFDGASKNSTNNRFSRKSRLLLILIVIILLVGGGFVGFKVFNSYESNKQAMKNTCTSNPSLIDEASVAMGKSDKDKLKKITDDITAKKGFENDQNCLFVITIYNISKADNKTAEEYFGKYSSIYNKENTSVAGSTRKYVWSKESLKQKLDFSKAFSDNLIENSKKLGHPNNLESKQ